MVEVSQQRLALDKVLAQFVAQIERVTAVKSGAIFLWDEGQKDLQVAHVWSKQPNAAPPAYELAKHASNTNEVVIDKRQMALPIKWQGRWLGSVIVELPSSKRVRARSVQLITALTEQIAPSLENAILHTATERQKKLLEGILNSSPSGILVLEQDQSLSMCNPGAERSLMLDSASVVGQPLAHLLERLNIPQETQTKLLERFKSAEPFREELRVGTQVFNLDAAPLGTLGSWVIILNDVSLLTELNELQTRLIRMASHDLKNPLARVMGFASFLEEDKTLSPENRELVGYIMRASQEMEQLISDILNLEKLRTGRIQREQVHLSEIVQGVLERHQPDMVAKQQQLTSDISKDLPIIMGDYRALIEAFSNLIGNAIKYTPEKGQIAVRLYHEDQHIHFEIKDTGYGIAKEAQAKLFTPFYRVRTKATSHIPGTGLGLSLAKEAVEAHEGRIWLESEEGAGTTFFVEFPIPKG